MMNKWRKEDELPRSEFFKVTEAESDETCRVDTKPQKYVVAVTVGNEGRVKTVSFYFGSPNLWTLIRNPGDTKCRRVLSPVPSSTQITKAPRQGI